MEEASGSPRQKSKRLDYDMLFLKGVLSLYTVARDTREEDA